MNKVLSFFKNFSIKKILLLFVLALIITAIIVFGPIIYKDNQEKKKKVAAEKQQIELKNKRAELESKVAAVKQWRIETQEGIGAKEVRLETKWQNGKMYYKFDVDLTKGMNETRRNRNSYNGFIVDFVDADGFKIFSFRIPLNSMTGIVSGNNFTTGLSVNDKISITAEEYLKLDQWQIGWNF